MKYEIGFSEHLWYSMISIFYITLIAINSDHDFFIIMREDEWTFWILFISWICCAFYILISYLYKKYKYIILLQSFIILLLYTLIVDIWENMYPNNTTYYYFCFYISLFLVHFIFISYCIYKNFIWSSKKNQDIYMSNQSFYE